MFSIPFAPRALIRPVVLAGVAALLSAAAPIMRPAAAAEVTHMQVSQASFGATQNLSLMLNKSVIIDLPADVKEVIVSQPSVAPTIMRTKRRAIIQGAAAGGTNVFFLDDAGRTAQ